MKTKRLVLIVNPASGAKAGKRVVSRILPVLSSTVTEVAVHETSTAGHAAELARELSLVEGDALVAVGGDGTLHEIINGVRHRADGLCPPIGVVPAGTGNSLARDLHAQDVDVAVERIARQRTRPLDLMRLNIAGRTLYAFNIVGSGLPADALTTAERLRWLGPSRYTVAGAFEIFRRAPRFVTTTFDAASLSGYLPLVLACNTKHTGNAMALAPEAEFGDGLVDVVVVRRAGRYALIRLLLEVANGTHVASPLVESCRCRRFSISYPHPTPFNVDGEILSAAEVDATVVPGALQVFA